MLIGGFVGTGHTRRPSFSFVGCCLVLALSGTLAAHQGEHPDTPERVPDAVLYRPTPMPDRIVLTWAGDPTSTQAVTWRTSVEVKVAWAEIAPADSGPRFRASAKRVDAQTRPFKSNLAEYHTHVVHFAGLEPGQKYAYRVGDGVNWSEWFQFRTASKEPEPFTFVYFGDAQNDIRSMWSRVIRQAWTDAPKAAFMVHAGDLVTLGENDALWGEWFGAGGWLNAMIPVIATPGNHEYITEKNPDGTVKLRRLTRHWPIQFAYPRHGPEGLEDSVFYVDYQNLRLISLNSNERPAEQAAWLEQVLAEHKQTWTALTFHHPIFSMARERDNPALRNAWKPVIDRHRVDLVLTGHDHTYGRSRLLMPEQNVTAGTNWRADPTGTVYVVSVSGPKMYNLDPPRGLMSRVAEDTQLYQTISIDGGVLRYESRTATGALYDAFTLRKRDGQPNEMIEQVPDTPARRHPPKK